MLANFVKFTGKTRRRARRVGLGGGGVLLRDAVNTIVAKSGGTHHAGRFLEVSPTPTTSTLTG